MVLHGVENEAWNLFYCVQVFLKSSGVNGTMIWEAWTWMTAVYFLHTEHFRRKPKMRIIIWYHFVTYKRYRLDKLTKSTHRPLGYAAVILHK